MTAVEILTMLSALAGGLAFFLYGMNVMSGGLEKLSGGKLEQTLRRVTSNYFMSFLLGAGITIAIQSSSAMTVMLVGLVNSGIMEFGQTIGIIMGSNVGTTLTSWLLSLNGIGGGSLLLTLLQPTVFAPILALIGIAIKMFSSSEQKKSVGMILVGFAILIAGMDMMSASVSKIREMESFSAVLTAFSNPLLAVLISTVFTGVIQSSAATVGIVQALALTGSITYEMAIPLILGANIGTCVTALLGAIGTNKNSKRVVVIHISFNVIGTAIFLIGLGIVNIVAPDLSQTPISMFGVAVIHTIFNVVTTVLLMPFSKFIIKLACFIVKDKDGKKEKNAFFDERIMNVPSLAIAECKNLVGEMAELSKEAVLTAIGLIDEYDADKALRVNEIESTVDKYEDKLGTYLVKFNGVDLTEHDSHEVGRLLHSIGDFERISDHAVNIVKTAEEIHTKKISFSSEASAEIKVLTEAIIETLQNAVASFIDDDISLSSKVEPLEQVVDGLCAELKNRHVIRLQAGKCTIELGFVFLDLITNYERISDHCSNIAVHTIKKDEAKQDTHKYLRQVRKEDDTFANDFSEYAKKYTLV